MLLAYLGMVGTQWLERNDIGTPLSFEQCTQLITSQPVTCEDHAEAC